MFNSSRKKAPEMIGSLFSWLRLAARTVKTRSPANPYVLDFPAALSALITGTTINH
jgi:hypothetical protein